MSTLDLLVGPVHSNKSWNHFSEEYRVAQSKLNFIESQRHRLAKTIFEFLRDLLVA